MKKVTLTRTCPFCGRTTEIEVDEEQLIDWEEGELIQDAFPDKTPEEREIIKTGICSQCWEEL